MLDLNGGGFTGASTQMPAGQTAPGVVVNDHRDAPGVATPAQNARAIAWAGILAGVIPVLSIVGVILSIVAYVKYRRIGSKPTLAIVGLVVSAVVLIAWVLSAFVLGVFTPGP